MRIFTTIVLDMETRGVLRSESYEYAGPVALCKASSNENQISGNQQQFYTTLSNDYNQQFANQSSILNSLTSAFTPIINAGPNQTGFSAPEEAAMRTSAMDSYAASYKSAAQSLNERLSAMGGGNSYLPSGASAEINAQLAEQAAQANAAQQQNITTSNYATGRQNFMNATSALSGAAGLYNPEGFMSGANNAGQAAFGSASQIQQQNSAWEGELGGALGGIAGDVLTGGMSNLGKGAGFFGQNAPAPS